MLRASIFAFFVMIPALAAAQEEGELPAEFSSDRPGFAISTAVAPQGRIITEMGATIEIEDPVLVSLPNLTLRAGVFEWLELRARGPDGVLVFEDDTRFGISDAFLGFKVGGLVHEQVSISAAFETSLPIATDGFGAEEAEFFASAQLEWRFWGPLSLTPNAVARVRARASTTGVERIFEGGGSLKLTWAIIDVLRVFAHGYVLATERGEVLSAVGGAVTWLVLPNVQLDAWFDIGVTDPQVIPPTVGAGTTVLW